MKSINSLPCEVIGLILANLESFAQLRDAILTCRSFHSSWKAHTGSILWHIGQLEIVGFTDALIAVRATEVAKEAILKGDLPPSPFPLGELSGEIRKPTLDELKILFDFRHLVECLERLAKKHSDPYWFDCTESLEPEDRIRALVVWKERFHVTMYRIFLSGAVLYRTYQEPLTLAKTCGPPRFLDQYQRYAEAEEDEEEDNGDEPFTSAEKRYLLQYPIFRFEEFQQHGDIFEPLADIFVKMSKRKAKVLNTLEGATLYERYGAKQHDPALLESSHAQALFHQLMQFMFVAHSSMLKIMIRNEDGSTYHDRENKPTPKRMSGRRRTVAVICFDVLSLEEIIMPENVEDAVRTFVLARPGVKRPVIDGSNLSGLEYASRNVSKLLDEIQLFSGQPNCYWHKCIAPPPELQFVRYMLSKYFRLRLRDDTWDFGNNNDPSRFAWDNFNVSDDVFSERILTDEAEHACALLKSIDAPLPLPYFDHRAWTWYSY